MICLRLSEAERTELSKRQRDRRMTMEARARLEMIRLSDWGLSAPTIAQRVGRHEHTVRKFLRTPCASSSSVSRRSASLPCPSVLPPDGPRALWKNTCGRCRRTSTGRLAPSPAAKWLPGCRRRLVCPSIRAT